MPAYSEPKNVYSHGPRRNVATILPAVLLLVVGALDAKADECKSEPRPFGFRPGEAKEVTLYVKKNTPCTVTFGRNPFAYLKQNVTKRPRGSYGVTNYIHGAYRPPSGYVGDDYFELLLNYQRLGVGQERYQSLLKVTAKITE
jgi:hypothetical protein